MSIDPDLVASEAEINKVAEIRYCSASMNPQLAPRMNLPKGKKGEKVSLPFSSPLEINVSLYFQPLYINLNQ